MLPPQPRRQARGPLLLLLLLRLFARSQIQLAQEGHLHCMQGVRRGRVGVRVPAAAAATAAMVVVVAVGADAPAAPRRVHVHPLGRF